MKSMIALNNVSLKEECSTKEYTFIQILTERI